MIYSARNALHLMGVARGELLEQMIGYPDNKAYSGCNSRIGLISILPKRAGGILLAS